MKSILNSPLEVAVRIVTLLEAAYPDTLDTNRLVLLDYGLLHSQDLGGPSNLHPTLPIRAGEFGVKRQLVDAALHVLTRSGLALMIAADVGIAFQAGERASGFVSALSSPYSEALKERAAWLVDHFADLGDDQVRQQMGVALGTWVEEFDSVPTDLRGGA